jgi:hypothetical protein
MMTDKLVDSFCFPVYLRTLYQFHSIHALVGNNVFAIKIFCVDEVDDSVLMSKVHSTR